MIMNNKIYHYMWILSQHRNIELNDLCHHQLPNNSIFMILYEMICIKCLKLHWSRNSIQIFIILPVLLWNKSFKIFTNSFIHKTIIKVEMIQCTLFIHYCIGWQSNFICVSTNWNLSATHDMHSLPSSM